jgi:hypothetical protein
VVSQACPRGSTDRFVLMTRRTPPGPCRCLRPALAKRRCGGSGAVSRPVGLVRPADSATLMANDGIECSSEVSDEAAHAKQAETHAYLQP